MATGMQSSRGALQNVQPSAPATIRVGERVATSPQALKNPNARTYHHMIPGARFVMPDGLEIQFLGGVFTTADASIIAELDAVADRNSSMIWKQKEASASMEAVQQQAADDAANTAGKAS